MMQRSFLVIQTAFTGDAILASSVIEKLYSCFPDASIDILLRKGNESLYEGHPFLRNILVWNKKENKLSGLMKLLSLIRTNNYGTVINLQRFASSGFLTAFSGAKETIGFDKNPFSFLFTRKVKHVIGDGRHETQRNQELIEHLTDRNAAHPRLYPAERDRNSIQRYSGKPYICIAPGSVWFTKTWPREKWLEFIKLYSQKHPGDMIFLLGSPNERPLCEWIQAASDCSNVTVLSGNLSLLESAALMKGAKMNYVNDSAPLHLAGSVNARVCAVYCSTIPDFGFGPLSDNSRVVETTESLSCRPCGLHGHKSCPQGHFRCALSIDPNQLLN